ncbi:MAG: four helix bundle protein [Blastocatellia bacterium]
MPNYKLDNRIESIKENVLLEKTFAFAVRVVNAYQYLIEERKEFVLSKQFVKSGKTIGANLEEAVGGQSRADFVAKLSIAYKEARETHYWVRLLKATGYFEESHANSLLNDNDEILKIIGSIQISTKNRS